jgi:hypothetical protein
MEPPRCPITQDFMHDPVMATDGQTYERAAIEQWFQTHNTSPYSGAILSSKVLTPNWAIKQMMEAYSNPPKLNVSNAISKPATSMPDITVIQKIFTHFITNLEKHLNVFCN